MISKISFELMESAAAIAMHFGESKMRKVAYDSACNAMGGFVGFYEAAVKAAVALEAAGIQWDMEADWIETTEKLSEAILNHMIDEGHIPQGKTLKRMVKDSICWN